MNYLNLPLSWIVKETDTPDLREIVSIGKRLNWYALISISLNDNWTNLFFFHKNESILIRGVGKHLKNLLSRNSFYSYETGREAIIKLDNELNWKKSLLDLCRRGKRHVKFREIEYSNDTIIQLEELKKNSRHSHKPELRYLFNNNFIRGMRLFIVASKKNTWLGALLISKNNMSKYHCELILKRRNAPTGIMEYLVTQTAQTLKSELINEFSLGEVPFISINLKNRFINGIIYLIRPVIKLAYNYKGLYFFKNKFNPEWEPVYLCSNRKISIPVLFFLSKKTNFLRLLLHKTLIRIKIFP